MSVYSRESVARRHNGIFNRGHLVPVDRESGARKSSPQPQQQETNTTQEASTPLTPELPSTINPGVSPDILPSSSPVSPSPTSKPLPDTNDLSNNVISSPSLIFTPPPTLTSSTSPTLGVGVASSKHGLSSGAIGAIIALVILFVAAIAAFVIRKVYMHRRALKRSTWGAGLVPALQTKRSTIYGGNEKRDTPNLMEQREKSVLNAPTPSLLIAPDSATSPKIPSLPPLSYNSTPSTFPVKAISPSRTAPKTDVTVVVRTFIPSLPDELNITTGEHIRVVTRYDDGWALCCNMRNEQGVVPLECLQRADTTAALQLQPQSEFGYGSDKSIKRLSSLVSNNNGTY